MFGGDHIAVDNRGTDVVITVVETGIVEEGGEDEDEEDDEGDDEGEGETEAAEDGVGGLGHWVEDGGASDRKSRGNGEGGSGFYWTIL